MFCLRSKSVRGNKEMNGYKRSDLGTAASCLAFFLMMVEVRLTNSSSIPSFLLALVYTCPAPTLAANLSAISWFTVLLLTRAKDIRERKICCYLLPTFRGLLYWRR